MFYTRDRRACKYKKKYFIIRFIRQKSQRSWKFEVKGTRAFPNLEVA